MNIRTVAASSRDTRPGLLVLGLFENESRTADSELSKRLKKELAARKITGRPCESVLVCLEPGRSVCVIGLGKTESHSAEKVRRAAAQAWSQTKSLREASVRIDLESLRGRLSLEETASACVEGVRLGSYTFTKYKSKPPAPPVVRTVELAAPGRVTETVRRAVREAETVSAAVTFVRDVANEPANVLTPPAFAAAARRTAARSGFSCRVLGPADLRRLGMGGILAVSQGSQYPPQLVILENRVKRPVNSRPVVLVGKGITFDTGGISIKPSSDMDKMKFDMCGAAAVLGAVRAISELGLPVKVVGLAAVCENMPDAKAQRPGDIIRISNGKTVEVLNTDAEGRLILADALSYAKRYEPLALVDIATLTGACSVTFADRATGLMGTDADLVGRIREAGEKTGERCWELPLWDEYAELIRATYADIQNISKKYAGTITAGMFLKEFASHASAWAHLDIAGTAWNDGGPKPLSPIGATGVGVRLFVELVRGYATHRRSLLQR